MSMFEGFKLSMIETGEVVIRVRHGGNGPPLLLLHGHPQTHYIWHKIAPLLARIFGDNVEEVLGTARYVVVYLACGLMGTLLQIAANPDSMIPTLGASGAIAGVMGAYVVWFPHNQVRVLVFQFLTQMPAAIVIGPHKPE